MRKTTAFAFLLIVVFGYFVFYRNNTKELSFDQSRWDPVLIAQLEAGPRYLFPDLIIDIPPPFPASSSETAGEIAYLKTLEERRMPEQEELINSQIDDFKTYFLEQAGINSSTKPLTTLLMKEVMSEVGFYVLREKWKFQRARPYDIDPSLHISIAPPLHSSYPSGHGGQSWAAATLLSALDPEYKDIWFDTARSIGHNREIAGVHFPSDTKAGQLIADQVMPILLKNAEFNAKFEQTKRVEWPVQ